MSSDPASWAVAIIGTLLAIVALRRCHGPWELKHILGALALFTIPLFLVMYEGGYSMDYQKRFDVPLTYQQAISEVEIDFPFPVSSRLINYAAYADWQVAGMFVRFEALVEDCLSHLETVQAWFNRRHSLRVTWGEDKIDSSSPVTSFQWETRMGPLSWFDPYHIRNGIHLRPTSDTGSRLEMWVGLDAGVFYYQWAK